MKKTRTFQRLASTILPSALALFIFAQCNSEDPKVETTQAAADTETVVKDGEGPVVSLTIDGIHTVISSIEDCKTCDYVVPENATLVDGKEIGIKPGQAICLNENFHYGNLKLINLEGEANNPITIAYGRKADHALAEN